MWMKYSPRFPEAYCFVRDAVEKVYSNGALLFRGMLSHVQLFATQWTVTRQAPLSMDFSRQEYWRRLPCPPPGIFPTQGSNPGLPQVDSLLSELPGILYRLSTLWWNVKSYFYICCVFLLYKKILYLLTYQGSPY